MKPLRLFVLVMFVSTVIFSQMAQATINANATVIKLRTSCVEGSATLNNCFVAFETISGNSLSGLQAWIDNRTYTTPLVIEIGPGTFKNFKCNAKNDISLRGSGPDQTKLSGIGGTYAIAATDCFRLNVQNLTVTNTGTAINWVGTGSSRWTNVTAESTNEGTWGDTCTGVTTNSNKPIHYWFNSRLLGKGMNYIAFCSENWFFGSEIMVTGRGLTLPNTSSAFVVGNSFSGVATTAKPEVHVYGSVVRVNVGLSDSYPVPSAGSVDGVIAVIANKDGEVHLHGTGVDVINTNGAGNIIAALSAYAGGSIHAHGSAYNLKPGNGGSAVRIIKDTNTATHVHAPYLWEEHPTPPSAASVTGADSAVITTGTSDGRPHLVVYDSSCPGTTKWYDTTDKVCR